LIEIDGSKKAGSGTILRTAIAFSAIKNQPLHIFNIRQNRSEPGLKPQHLEAVLTAARLCNAEVKGGKLNSQELWFNPSDIVGGRIEAEIGTAGSIPMLLMTILPICAYAKSTVTIHVTKGGTDVSHSPTINYVRYVLSSVLKKMGLNTTISVNKYGYYPKGNGEITAIVEPTKNLKPLILENHGTSKTVKGLSVCTFLADRKVAERQANTADSYFREKSFKTNIQIVNDTSNPLQKGSSITLWAETDAGAILGADAIGELKKTSEKVCEEASHKLWEEIQTKPTVDVHMADILVPYVALAAEKSVYFTRTMSEHLETNIWLAEEILEVKFKTERANGLYRIEKTGQQ
jgi:RNA 3'-terminal phosphate cyclase (ATP)